MLVFLKNQKEAEFSPHFLRHYLRFLQITTPTTTMATTATAPITHGVIVNPSFHFYLGVIPFLLALFLDNNANCCCTRSKSSCTDNPRCHNLSLLLNFLADVIINDESVRRLHDQPALDSYGLWLLQQIRRPLSENGLQIYR